MIGPAAGVLLAETRRRPGRLLLTGVAILVATVFAAGTLLLGETLRLYVASSAQETPSGAAVVIRPAPSDPLPAVDGVAATVGFADTTLPVGGAGATSGWEIASDPMGGPLTRLIEPPVAGRLAAAANEVVVGRATAERTGLAPGATLTIAPSTVVTVVGVVDVPLDGVNTLLAFPDVVQGLGAPVDQIDVAATPGTDPAVLAERVAAVVDDPGRVRTGAEQRVIEAESASASVAAVLVGVGVFAGLAMVAAAVVVASTFRIVLTQRRTQLALLRCVGARRGQVIGAVLAEAVVSGLVAGLLGVVVAVGGGFGVLGALAAFGVPDAPVLGVPWPALAGCVVVAVVATVLAALAPALAAARTPPVAALGAAGAGEAGSPRPGRRLALAGVLASAAAGMATLGAAIADEPGLIVVAASGMVTFAAIVAAGPVLVRALAATVGRLIAIVGGAPGRLATANATQVPRRTAATISVLALGVGLTSALLVALASTEADAQASIDRLFPTDIALSSPDPRTLAGRLATEPTVVVVSTDATAVYVDPAPGVDAAAARAAVDAAVTGQPDVTVQYAADARADVESVVVILRLIGLGLVGMTMLVAVVGVAVTLLLSVTERTRETGLLRAVGLSRSGVRAMVAWEAALSGVGAAVLGAVVGAVYGVLGSHVLGVGVGFTVGSVPTLAVLVVGVVAVAVLAAVAPAVRAGRVTPIRAMQDA